MRCLLPFVALLLPSTQAEVVEFSNLVARTNTTGDIMDAHDGTYNQWGGGCDLVDIFIDLILFGNAFRRKSKQKLCCTLLKSLSPNSQAMQKNRFDKQQLCVLIRPWEPVVLLRDGLRYLQARYPICLETVFCPVDLFSICLLGNFYFCRSHCQC